MSRSAIGNAARRGLFGWRRGQSAVELALAATVLSVLLVGAADFARMFYVSIAVNNAARAGAQFGSQSVITAADSSGITTAVDNDATNITINTPTSSMCTCDTSAPTTDTQCPSSYCTDSSSANYVTVTVTAPFNTIANYPGIPSSTTLTGTAVMQVQQ